ncbi:MAG: plasmid pRiA4b ORF-3 family protein [bacterium]
MAKIMKEVYQFKITLNESKPPIWRRILVPSKYSFWDLHIAIQDSMGWKDYHLHSFNIINPLTGRKVEIGIPDEDYEDILPDNKIKISKYFNENNAKATYEYDFGDSWIHTIKLEKIIPAVAGEKYPQCIGGKMACPPEDCGGIWGYYNLLEIIQDPKHDEYEESIEWLGEDFDPNEFDPKDVTFDDPKERFNLMNDDESEMF